MKELSIEEKAKAYDKAIERVRELLSCCIDDRDRRTKVYRVEDIESIFPELKESEDERIRKVIRGWIYTQPASFFDNGISKEKMLAWLEKQGEQKPSYKDEPKFKVGDILVSEEEDRRHIYKVDAITNYGTYLLLDLEDGYTRNESVYICDLAMYLWSIQDAKDGDVLVDVHGNIGIYKKHYDFDWTSCCSIGCNGGFQCFKVEHENENTTPATKGQRDLLFSKMKEAGYEWDADKKS